MHGRLAGKMCGNRCIAIANRSIQVAYQATMMVHTFSEECDRTANIYLASVKFVSRSQSKPSIYASIHHRSFHARSLAISHMAYSPLSKLPPSVYRTHRDKL